MLHSRWVYQKTTGLIRHSSDFLIVGDQRNLSLVLGDGENYTLGLAYTSVDMNFTFPLDEPARGSWYSNASTALDLWNGSQEIVSTWVSSEGHGPSIGAAMITCDELYLNGICEPHRSWTPFMFTTCSVLVRWQPMEIFVNPGIDRFVHLSGFDSPDQSLDKWLRSNLSDFDKQKVQIDADWANSALPPEAFTHMDTVFGVTVTTWIADAMARSGMSNPVILKDNFEDLPLLDPKGYIFEDYYIRSLLLSSEHPETNLEESTPIDIQQWRNGYSYSLTGSTRRLAFGILLVHILFALIHTTLLICIGWSCNILKSLCEIVALAIKSSPTPILENTCVGIARLDTYKHIVKVREVSEQHLGLVLAGEEGSSKSVVMGNMYGNMGFNKGHLKVE